MDVEFGEGQRWVELTMEGTPTKLVLHTPQGQEDRIGTMSNIIFYTEDIHKTHEELKTKGVEFCQEPTKESWGWYFLMKDCEDNIFCVSSTA